MRCDRYVPKSCTMTNLTFANGFARDVMDSIAHRVGAIKC